MERLVFDNEVDIRAIHICTHAFDRRNLSDKCCIRRGRIVEGGLASL